MSLLITQSGMKDGSTAAFTTDQLQVWLYLKGDFHMGWARIEIQHRDGKWSSGDDLVFTGPTQAVFSVAPGTKMRLTCQGCRSVDMEAHDNVVA